MEDLDAVMGADDVQTAHVLVDQEVALRGEAELIRLQGLKPFEQDGLDEVGNQSWRHPGTGRLRRAGRERGGQGGQLELVDIVVQESRRDYAFQGVPGVWTAFNRPSAQMVAGMDAAEGVPVSAGSYLATFVYRVPHEASGEFVIELRYDDKGSIPTERTFLFGPYAGLLEVATASPVQVDVAGRRSRGERTVPHDHSSTMQHEDHLHGVPGIE